MTWPQQSTIDEEKINSLLGMLHDADPTSGEMDPPDLARLEEQVNTMGPMIDTELEKVDRRHAQLTRSEILSIKNSYFGILICGAT